MGRKGEKHQYVVASCTPPTGDLACNPGVYPDRESHQRPFGSQASTQSTESHQPGEFIAVLNMGIFNCKNKAIFKKKLDWRRKSFLSSYINFYLFLFDFSQQATWFFPPRAGLMCSQWTWKAGREFQERWDLRILTSTVIHNIQMALFTTEV